MFFYIGDNCPLTSLKQVEPRLFLDDGWNQKNGIWYKGYSTECVLSESLISIIEGFQPLGKWCVIYNENIYHPKLRGFPINHKDAQLTNLQLPGFETHIYGNLPEPTDDIISLDDAAIAIGDILYQNTEGFIKYNQVEYPLLPISSGLDSTTAWALLDNVTKNYIIVGNIADPSEQDDVVKYCGSVREYHSDLIDKVCVDYWGYTHVSFYKELQYFISGYDSEMLQYRDTLAINALANYYGKNIDEIANESDYLYWFLKRSTHDHLKKQKLVFENEADLKKYLFTTFSYDFQMWHLDNNIYFTPFYDHRIPYIMHKLSVEDLVVNAMNGEIQRKIIERFKPDLLPTLADYKNIPDAWGNFKDHFMNVILDPETKINLKNFSSVRQKSS